MKIKVNGEEKVFEAVQMSITELLKVSRVDNPELVSVQLNQTFVDRSRFSETVVSETDEVDFLYFMGGGR